MTDQQRSPGERITIGLVVVLVVPVVIILVIPFLLIAVPANWARARWLKLRWERTWGRQGKRVLLVYSRSPNWQSYIETTWLPKIGSYAVVLDWSDRSNWPKVFPPLEIRAFRHWAGDSEFNPLVLLFPKHGTVRTIRFWKAFRDYKHGKEGTLRAAEAELFAFIDGIRGQAA